jgi:dolichyl-phosphate-mannose--protein O-mannosyl transferase
VTFNEVITLLHKNTKMKLHSHNEQFEIDEETGESQQEVTCYGGNDSNDNWKISLKKRPIPSKQIFEEIKESSDIVRYGDKIILKHYSTEMFLGASSDAYFHDGSSSQNQVYATNSLSDHTSFIIVSGFEEENKDGEKVEFNETICLKNVATGHRLHSHYASSPVSNQQEVTSFNGEDENGLCLFSKVKR